MALQARRNVFKNLEQSENTMRTFIAVIAAATIVVVPLTVSADEMIGGDRPATLRVPRSLDPRVPAPFLVLLHGIGMSGSVMESITRFPPLADEAGILFVAPDGLDSPEGLVWVEGFGDENSAYLRGLIDEVIASFNVDRDRIFIVGYSNGGISG